MRVILAADWGYTSVSRLINTEPSELLRLRLSEQIASESVKTEPQLVKVQVNVAIYTNVNKLDAFKGIGIGQLGSH